MCSPEGPQQHPAPLQDRLRPCCPAPPPQRSYSQLGHLGRTPSARWKLTKANHNSLSQNDHCKGRGNFHIIWVALDTLKPTHSLPRKLCPLDGDCPRVRSQGPVFHSCRLGGSTMDLPQHLGLGEGGAGLCSSSIPGKPRQGMSNCTMYLASREAGL